MESCKACVPTAKCPSAGATGRKAAGAGKWEEVHQVPREEQGKANNKAASAMAPRQDSKPAFTGAQMTKTTSNQKGLTGVMLFSDCDDCVLSP